MSPEPSPLAASDVVDVMSTLDGWRAQIDDRLHDILSRPVRGSVHGLDEAIRYSLLSPGKRVRPALVLGAAAACDASGIGSAAPAGRVDIAISFELVHAYSLVHDDLPCMDDDDLRRGMPTSHVRWGEGVAVLVGDALQAEAFRCIAAAHDVSAAARIDIVELLAGAAGWTGMVGGQYLDLRQDRVVSDVAGLRDVHDRKTGALIAGAVEAGAIVGGADDVARDGFRRFGVGLGWLFQLVDDLLDVTGDEARIGKPVGTDHRLEKLTAVDVFGVDGARAAAATQLEECLDIAAGLPSGGGVLPGVARYIHGRDH